MPTAVQTIWIAIKAGWMKFAHVLGWINTRILLTVTYLLLIGPTALVTLVLGKDLLKRRLRKSGSYWTAKEPIEHSLERAKRQF